MIPCRLFNGNPMIQDGDVTPSKQAVTTGSHDCNRNPRSPAEEPRSTRNRPCDACRKRKSRCVVNETAKKCVLCDFHNQDCTYIDEIPPRKRKSASVEGELTRRLSNETSRKKLAHNIVVSGNRSDAVEEYADLKGPSLLKRTLGLQRRHHGLYVGSSGRIEPTLISLNGELGLNTASQGISFRHVSDGELFTVCSDQGTKLYEAEQDDLDAIESLVAPHGKALIGLYFRIVHPSFPILHKKVYLEKYERTYREFAPVLLASVYILAVDYWTYSAELSGFAKPNVHALEALALKTINYAIHRPKLSTVEAGLLLLQRSSESSWPLTAQMVAIGQDLGLHRDCSNWDIPEWEKGLRKRLAWALFMQDKWAGLAQGRPSHIFKSDWSVKPLSESDFPENVFDENDEEGSTEVEQGRSLFIWMVSLTQILSDILATFYSGADEEPPLSIHMDATARALTKAKPLQIRLKTWFARLPKCLNIEHIRIRKLSSSGYLHLAYWTTELSLHRCIIRTLDTGTDSNIAVICQNAATSRSKAAMQFVSGLRPEHWGGFWFFASEFGFGLIGLFEILISTSFSSENDISASVARLDHYIWTLKVSQKNAEFLHKAIAMIDIAAKHVVRRIPVTSSIPLEQAQCIYKDQTTKYAEHADHRNQEDYEALLPLSVQNSTASSGIIRDIADSDIFPGMQQVAQSYSPDYLPTFDGSLEADELLNINHHSEHNEMYGIRG